MIAMGLLALSLLGALAFLIAAAFSQKVRPFRERRGFSLFLGMFFPVGLGLLGLLAAGYGPQSLLRAIDESPVIAAAGALFVFLGGILWGARRGVRKPV